MRYEEKPLLQHQRTKERMKAAGRVQTLLWLSAESSALLKQLSADMRLTQPEVIGLALEELLASENNKVQTEQNDNRFIDSFKDALEDIMTRLDALEKPKDKPAGLASRIQTFLRD